MEESGAGAARFPLSSDGESEERNGWGVRKKQRVGFSLSAPYAAVNVCACMPEWISVCLCMGGRRNRRREREKDKNATEVKRGRVRKEREGKWEIDRQSE